MPTSTVSLPYAHLNLRRNPFGELTPEERAALAVVDAGPWAGRLRAARGTIQFVGESGRGKTTRLLALRRELGEVPLRRIHEGVRFEVPAEPIVLLDEVQFLSRRARRDLFSGPASLALGTHVDFTHELRRAGRECETVTLRGLPEGHLGAIVNARIEHVRRGPGPVPRVGVGALRALIAAHGDDIRSIEGRLYDAIQNMKEPGHVEV